jgi:hypothetical protein
VYEKNIESITKEVYKRYLTKKVIPAIKAQWPRRTRNQIIYIQQDNARPHVCPEDEDIILAGQTDGWNIRLICQPPNSPDYNVLDLGFFRAIQSIQLEEDIFGTEMLIKAVKNAFNKMTPKTLNAVFLTLQNVMLCALNADGGNDFKLPHMKKGKLERQKKLPHVLSCQESLYRKARSLLQ